MVRAQSRRLVAGEAPSVVAAAWVETQASAVVGTSAAATNAASRSRRRPATLQGESRTGPTKLGEANHHVEVCPAPKSPVAAPKICPGGLHSVDDVCTLGSSCRGEDSDKWIPTAGSPRR